MEVQLEEKPDWIKIKPAEVEKLVIEHSKKEISASQIGAILRDQHGIPKTKLLGKRISQILLENKISSITEKQIMQERIKFLEAHITKKPHDKNAKRSLIKKLWAINKLK